MKKINFKEINTEKFIEMPEKVLKDIEGGCIFYKDYDTCTGKFLHNRRKGCSVTHNNITGNYTKRYHYKKTTCIGPSW
jgi:hypothetical protein